MSIQDLGAIGELVAAIATVATLIYLAVQLRQNTRALRSATFQQISAQMGQNVETITTNADLAEIVAKTLSQDPDLTPAERIRLQGLFVMSMRRIEAVFVQSELGSIDPELATGFENSLLPLLLSSEGAAWWRNASRTFHAAFVAYVNRRLASGAISTTMPSLQVGPVNDSA